jgi:O-Antigen ligase
MALSLRELLVVLVLASLVFMLAKPIALTFTPAADFKRRRRAWFALTIIAFLSPSFWLFIAVAIPILIVTGRRDSNPVAVYLLLLHVIPPVSHPVPMVGMSFLFELNSFLLLSFCILTPAAIRMLRARDRPRYRVLMWMDLALLGYGLLNSFHYLQAQAVGGALYPVTTADSIRRAVIFLFITYIPYFVTSRSSVDRRALVDNIASYCLASGLLAAIAIFESLRGWLLYGELPMRWGTSTGTGYLIREHALRAMASAGHPLTLATLLSIAVAFWLYLRPRVESARARLGFSILLGTGLLVTWSRGPWIGAAVSGLVFLMLKPRALSAMFKTTIGVLLAGAALSMTPFGQKIFSLLPIFGGKSDLDTLTYRENLVNRAVDIIGQHPFIGDTTALAQMQDLRQGQGIIDLVNVYIQVLLNDGFVGLTLLLGFLLLGVAKVNAARRRSVRSDPDTATLGAALMACTAGFLVTLAGGSLGSGTERMYYMLGALMAGYVVSDSIRRAAPSRTDASQ